MKFPYLKLYLDERSDFFGTHILKPIIPLKIKAPGKEVRYGALIDSGADFCIFDAEIGEYLGFDIRSGKRLPFGGIQDRTGAEAFLHEAVINIGGWDYKTALGFSYDIAKHGFGILGQKGFFDIFAVKFDYRKEEIELGGRK